MRASVRFVGTGEAFDPSLTNTSVLYRGHQTLLLDCGYSVPHAWWRMDADPDTLDGIFLTHCHADHCFGLPALVVWMRLAGRRRPLRLLGGRGSAVWIREVLELGYSGAYDSQKCFPIEFVEVAPGSTLHWEGLALSTAVSQHGATNHAVRIDADERSFCYSGDGAPTEATRSLFTECNLLVHECFRPSAGLDGHAHAEQLLELAREVRVDSLCLVHLESPPANRAAVADAICKRDPGQQVVIPAPGDAIDLR